MFLKSSGSAVGAPRGLDVWGIARERVSSGGVVDEEVEETKLSLAGEGFSGHGPRLEGKCRIEVKNVVSG